MGEHFSTAGRVSTAPALVSECGTAAEGSDPSPFWLACKHKCPDKVSALPVLTDHHLKKILELLLLVGMGSRITMTLYRITSYGWTDYRNCFLVNKGDVNDVPNPHTTLALSPPTPSQWMVSGRSGAAGHSVMPLVAEACGQGTAAVLTHPLRMAAVTVGA